MKNEVDKTNRRRERKAITALCIILTVVFSCVIILVSAAFIIKEDKDISDSENRVLSKRPKLTLSSVYTGTFMQNFETWLSDQFPFRDKIIEIKTAVDRVCGRKEENGVYFGKNGFLLKKQSEYNESIVDSLTESINDFTAKYPAKAAVLISPNSSSILSDFMPKYAYQSSQKIQLSKIEKKITGKNIEWIDCFNIFSQQKDKTKLYYRTDHHWTTFAAYTAFEELMKKWKIDISKTDFRFETVTADFQGTLASSSAYSGITDEIQICAANDKKINYVVTYESSNEKKATLFDTGKLSEKNKYEVFLGGNYDKVTIETDSNENRTLLLLKDSYANCMLPMLTAFFSKIIVIDPRYYSDKISEVMEENEVSHILFLYNLNTFLEDTSLPNTLAN